MAAWNRSFRSISRLQELQDPDGYVLDHPAVQLMPPDSGIAPVHGSTSAQVPLSTRMYRQAAAARHQAASLVTPSALGLTLPLAIAWFGMSGGASPPPPPLRPSTQFGYLCMAGVGSCLSCCLFFSMFHMLATWRGQLGGFSHGCTRM